MAVQHLAPGVNPLDPAVIAQMKAESAAIEAAHDQSADLTDLSDARERFTVLGMPARPLSAGMIAILEKMKHPIFSQTDETELLLEDMIIIMYLVLAPDEDTLIEQAMAGTLRKCSMKWAFTLDGAFLQAAQSEIQRMIEEYGQAAETYAGAPGGDGKKKPEAG